MQNPDGPYPGRQLFLGMTGAGDPFFTYLVTGRSPESRERKAVLINDVVRIMPLGKQAYDPLRHYSAVKFDNDSGTLAVSNGIQTEAVFETYKLVFNTASLPTPVYMEKIMEGAGAEPDSQHTPRIAGVIAGTGNRDGQPVFIIGIKAFNSPARAYKVEPRPGTMTGISTYNGSMDNPEARDPSSPLSEVPVTGHTPEELARFLFDISSASYKGNDIRVCSVGGIFSGKQGWNISINNVYP